jgi:hypothetical protein
MELAVARNRISKAGFRVLVVICCVLWHAGTSRAFEVVVESVSIHSDPVVSVTDYLDVYIRLEDGETDPPAIAGWQVAVDLEDPEQGLAFLGAEAPTAPHAPLIGENFEAGVSGPDGGDRASAADYVSEPMGSVPFVDGAGLVRVPFEVAPGTMGSFSVRLDLDPFEGVFLVDAEAGELPYQPVDGVISVPEPAAELCAAAVLACLLLLSGRRRRRCSAS